MDPKYGRIFTEADVKAILGESVSDESLESLVSRIDTRFGDEPLFVIRAQDNLALVTIDDYASNCEDSGCDPSHLSNIMNARQAVDDWQQSNPDKVKLPD
jgi:hypothetical protein